MGRDGPKHHARSEHQRRVTIRFGLKVGVFGVASRFRFGLKIGVFGVLNAAHAASGLPSPFFHVVGL
jgi:hypothetical protein